MKEVSAVFFDDLICKFKRRFKRARFSFGKHLSILAYADDLVFISNDPKELKKMLDFVVSYAADNEFEFHKGKCKILKLHKKCTA